MGHSVRGRHPGGLMGSLGLQARGVSHSTISSGTKVCSEESLVHPGGPARGGRR